MKSKNNKISAEVKSQVMLELSKPGCGVRNISRQYGVSRATIYKWLKARGAIEGWAMILLPLLMTAPPGLLNYL